MRQAAVRYHRIVAERSDGRQNADSRDVQGERRAERGQNPGSRIDLALRRFRRLPFGNADAADHPPVAPEIRHPLQGDHRCRETHRTAAQRRRGIRIRHAETAVRLQRLLAAAKRRHDLLRTGRRGGLVRLRGERLRGEEPQDKRTEESGRRVGALRERHHAPVYRRQHRPRRGSGLHADARFRLRRQQDPDRRSAQEGRVCGAGPQRRGGTARGGGDLLRTAQTEPEPEGPDPLRHEIPHLGRQEPALHLSRIARHGEFRHRNKPERAQQGRAAAQGELYVHGQPAVAGAGDPLRGQRLRPPLVERHVPAVRIGELPQGAGARAENIRQQPAAVLPAELLRRRLLFGYGLRVAHRPRYDRRSLGQGIDQARPLQHLFAGSQPPDNRRPEVDVPAGDQGRRTAGSHRRV
ncbi:unknown [Alistipes finegoldii CAG:68]|nr:unknown [Alistipes finegoldii CAG:68]